MGTDRIRELNDSFRQRIGAMSRQSRNIVSITPSIDALGADAVNAILLMVQVYDRFLPEDDPGGEHNLGAFDYGDHRVFWKIAYYDNNLKRGSDDPSDPDQTRRVLTVMLAGEYGRTPPYC